mmetsp:Transcript_17677/g.57358  ORF Transcript_17677/g.57358 Transcript_17677/m.57358 type:complete len:118 (+) Transcript_17677:430-783(+)
MNALTTKSTTSAHRNTSCKVAREYWRAGRSLQQSKPGGHNQPEAADVQKRPRTCADERMIKHNETRLDVYRMVAAMPPPECGPCWGMGTLTPRTNPVPRAGSAATVTEFNTKPEFLP